MNRSARHAIRLGLTALLTFSVAGAALARPDTRTMTCAQTQNLIVRSGAIVLTTGRHTYDRYVAASRLCAWPNVSTATYVRTRDTNRCVVYNCQRYEPLFDDSFLRN
jgi:hypothetical protein